MVAAPLGAQGRTEQQVRWTGGLGVFESFLGLKIRTTADVLILSRWIPNQCLIYPSMATILLIAEKMRPAEKSLVASFQFQQFLDDLGTAESGSTQIINQSLISSALARIAELETVSPLTSDDTGFSVDSTLLTVDMTLA